MADSNGGFGSCLTTILIILVFLAAFGFVDWSTVGSFARFILAIFIAGILMIVAIWIFGNSRK